MDTVQIQTSSSPIRRQSVLSISTNESIVSSTPSSLQSTADKCPLSKVETACTLESSGHEAIGHDRSISIGLVALTLAAPVVAAIIWWVMVAQPGHGLQSIVQMATIGGRMSLGLAKGVDFVSGAVLAPLLMAAFNWCWFDSAQTSAFAEHESQPVPLSVAVEASCTSSGVYDFFKLQKLLKPRKGKFTVLAVLTLLSAVSKTLMSNIVAYESFTVSQGDRNVTLRLLSDKTVLDNSRKTTARPWQTTETLYGFTLEQHLSLARRISSLHMDFNIRNNTAQLFPDGTYLAVNATSESLNKVDSDITRLTGVPGFKLMINCTSDFNFTLGGLNIMQPRMQVTQITTTDYKRPSIWSFNSFSVSDTKEILLRQNLSFSTPIQWFVGYGYGPPEINENSDAFLGAMTPFRQELVVPKLAFSSPDANSGERF